MCLRIVHTKLTKDMLKKLKKDKVDYIECTKNIVISEDLKTKNTTVHSRHVFHFKGYSKTNNINENHNPIPYAGTQNGSWGPSKFYTNGFHSYAEIPMWIKEPLTLRKILNWHEPGNYTIKVWVPVKDISVFGWQDGMRCIVSQSFTFIKPKIGNILGDSKKYFPKKRRRS